MNDYSVLIGDLRSLLN